MKHIWKQHYKERSISADEAAAKIKSGDMIVYGHACAQPKALMDALLKRKDELRNVGIAYGFTINEAPFCDPVYEGSFRVHSVFNSAGNRQAQWEGRADLTPVNMSDVDRFFGRKLPVDVLFVQCTPPDSHGNVSLGISCDYTRGCVELAGLTIAQVNENMPWIYGDTVIPAEKIDYFVEAAEALPEIPQPSAISEVDRAIAGNVASLINDGDTIQAGVGSVPDTILSLLENHKNIGIHTELASTGVMQLIEKGVVTNARKTLDAGKVVCTILGGTNEFYEYIDDNPIFEMRRCSYTNSPLVIARQKNICAINSALEVDLYGQVCADMMGYRHFSGVGGQLDFLRGAAMAEGGKSFICLPSTAKKGAVSRIVPLLTEGAAVTDTRFDVMYVVTEHGIADLWGKTVAQRAKELIGIADPKFREDLERAFAEKMKKTL
ncbi:MAG: 4-hydroxybutyrate CoA-transferase [Clostridiales Family XIII bacterium]|nr:4-hydroxybutyrate CoA-transferase [Clostridiales Family XIII bacterium]